MCSLELPELSVMEISRDDGDTLTRLQTLRAELHEARSRNIFLSDLVQKQKQ